VTPRAAFRRGGGLAAAILVSGAGLTARAASAEDAAAPKPWYQEIACNGFVSTSYSYGFNRPDSRTNAYRVFDFDDNTFKVDVAELVVQHPVAKPRESGFRVDMAMGGSVPRVSAAAGLFRDPMTGLAEDIDLQQAFASYVAPLGTGLRVDAGKFVTHFGAEVIQGYDGWNDNATRSFLFGYAIPFTHLGLRASYTFDPRLAATAMVVNGWDQATDDNRSKSAGAQLAITPYPAFTLYLNGMVGAEGANNESDLRRMFDVVASLKASRRVTVGVNLDYGEEDGAVPATPSRTAAWSGSAGYLRFTASDRLALIVRGEAFKDRDGVRTRVVQTLSELTLTPELRVSSNFILRGDLRLDRSSQRFFMKQAVDAFPTPPVSANASASF